MRPYAIVSTTKEEWRTWQNRGSEGGVVEERGVSAEDWHPTTKAGLNLFPPPPFPAHKTANPRETKHKNPWDPRTQKLSVHPGVVWQGRRGRSGVGMRVGAPSRRLPLAGWKPRRIWDFFFFFFQNNWWVQFSRAFPGRARRTALEFK